MTGIELIAKERAEQIEKHNFTLEHDLENNDGNELSFNAAVLASPVMLYELDKGANSFGFRVAETEGDYNVPNLAYEKDSNVRTHNYNLGKKNRIKQLTVAGALIAAEIDRLQNTK